MSKIIFKVIAFIIVIIILFITYIHLFGSKGLKINEYVITNNKLNDHFHGVKIVQISDINFGTTIKNNELSKIIDKINYLKPDIVVLTGDLINHNISISNEYKQQLIDNLGNIKASLGKYFVSGEQDYSYEFYEDIITNSDFINLDNTIDLIYNKNNVPILIAGLSANDPSIQEFTDWQTNNLDNNLYKILLVHKPDVIDSIDYQEFDLILAGHTLGGELNLPLLKTNIEGASKYYKKFYQLNNTKLYISNGVGNLLNHYRFNNKPSINLFRLKNK